MVPWHGVVAPGAGATQSPPVIPFTCQVTLPTGLPPAVTVKFWLMPAGTAGPPGEICRACEAVTFTVALPVAPCELAVTMSGVAGTVPGAVYMPLFGSIVPAPITDQVTVAGLVPPVTLAVNACIEPTATLGFDAVTIFETAPFNLPPPRIPRRQRKPVERLPAEQETCNSFAFQLSILSTAFSIFELPSDTSPLKLTLTNCGLRRNFDVMNSGESIAAASSGFAAISSIKSPNKPIQTEKY